jgi:ribulose-phosphate 3-epimerase
MASVVPAILAEDPADFTAKFNRVKGFARRLHVDIADQAFTGTRTINLAQLQLPQLPCDLHLMLQTPQDHLETVISLHPHLAIIHFEADGNKAALFKSWAAAGIKTGLALLPKTPVATAAALIKAADHVMVFTGHLGFYGGLMQVGVLPKIKEVKHLNPKAEVSVDGGVNGETARLALQAGADVLISGAFIVSATEPLTAFNALSALAGSMK